jgi:predicted nucleic acid-binding protein
MNAGKRFFDTNVLLYLHDDRDLRKQQLAQRVFGQYLEEGALVLSTQVVQEFYVAASRKLKLPRALVHALILDYLCLPLVHIEPRHIRRALENEEAYRISFWDALILAGAEEAKAEVSSFYRRLESRPTIRIRTGGESVSRIVKRSQCAFNITGVT